MTAAYLIYEDDDREGQPIAVASDPDIVEAAKAMFDEGRVAEIEVLDGCDPAVAFARVPYLHLFYDTLDNHAYVRSNTGTDWAFKVATAESAHEEGGRFVGARGSDFTQTRILLEQLLERRGVTEVKWR